MKLSTFICTVLFFTLTLAGAQGHGEHCGTEKGHGKGYAMKAKFELLDLSTEQRETINAIRVDTEKEIIRLKADIELKRIDLEQEFKADEPNRTRIMKLLEDITDVQLTVKKARADAHLKIHGILTPEQREELKAPARTVIKKKIIEKHDAGF